MESIPTNHHINSTIYPFLSSSLQQDDGSTISSIQYNLKQASLFKLKHLSIDLEVPST